MVNRTRFNVGRFATLVSAGASALCLPGAANAQAVADICTGLQVTLPVLQPIGNVASGLLAGVLDPVLNGIVGNVNTNIRGALSGQTIGVRLLDRNGNLVSVPGNCRVAVDQLTVNANKGITLGGGQISGLGGPANAVASAGEINSIALGNGAATSVGATSAIAIGLRGSATAIDAVALGRDTSVTAAGGIALGAGSVAARPGMGGSAEMFSTTPVASTAGALSIGSAGGERQITNVAGGTAATDAVNVRQLRSVGDNLAVALGGGAQFSTTNGAFTGPSFTVHGAAYTDVGSAIAALDSGPVAVNIPIASNNVSNLAGPTARGADSIAIGFAAASGGERSAAFGTGASAAGTASAAMGSNALASGAGAVAVGAGATAAGTQSVALGENAGAAQTGAVAIGGGVVTTRANQVAIGGAQSTYTLEGLASPGSRAAQSGRTSFVTTDSAGNLATSSFDPNALTGRMGSLSESVDNLRKESRMGTASAMAMTSASMPSARGKTSWAVNTATFKGEWAAGFSVAHRLNVDTPLALTAGYSNAGGTTHGVRMGLAGEF